MSLVSSNTNKMILVTFLLCALLSTIEVHAGKKGPNCPAVDGEDSVYIPHKDCTKFWQCSNGTPYLFDCPDNLHFNPKLNVCDWPNQAGCRGGGGLNSDEKSDEDKTNSGGGGSDSDEKNDEDKNSKCPAVDGDESVYLPDEDCGRFWQCSNGVAYLQNCPSGLHFNTELNVCDWPDAAGCDGSSSSSSSSESDSDSSSSSSSEEDDSESVEDDDVDDGDNGGDDGGSGGDDDGSGGDDGGSGGDDGSNGGDDDGSGGDDDGSGGDDGGSGGDDDGSGSDSSESNGSGSNEDLRCPAKDGADPVYIPDRDCTKFWQCSNGTPYPFDCPDGLHFNPSLNVCDWPAAAGCKGK